MMSRDAVLSDPAICRPSVGDVSSSTGTVIGWIAVPLFGTYYIPESGTVKGVNCVRIIETRKNVNTFLRLQALKYNASSPQGAGTRRNSGCYFSASGLFSAFAAA